MLHVLACNKNLWGRGGFTDIPIFKYIFTLYCKHIVNFSHIYYFIDAASFAIFNAVMATVSIGRDADSNQDAASKDLIENHPEPVEDKETQRITVTRSSEPYNEFSENDRLLYSCFPFLFLLGRGLLQTGSVPVICVRHMLFQFHGRFSACHRFIFCLFDQFQRHTAARTLAATIKSNDLSFSKFSEWVNDPEFTTRLSEASKNPFHPDSVSLLKELMPHVSVMNTKVPYTTAQRKTAMGHLYAMVGKANAILFDLSVIIL